MTGKGHRRWSDFGGGNTRSAAEAESGALAFGFLHVLVQEGHLDMSKVRVLVFDLAKDKKQRDVLTLQASKAA